MSWDEELVEALTFDSPTIKRKALRKAEIEGGRATAYERNTGWTALMWAAVQHDMEVMEKIAPRSDLKQRDRAGRTALMLAVENDFETGVSHLMGLMKKEELEEKDTSGETALIRAARIGNARVVKALSERCNVEAQGFHLQTALMVALFKGHDDAVDVLLPLSDLTVKDNKGNGLIHLAVMTDSIRAVAYLLPSSDLSERGEDGRTALEMAQDFGMTEIAQMIKGFELAKGEHALMEGEVSRGMETQTKRKI